MRFDCCKVFKYCSLFIDWEKIAGSKFCGEPMARQGRQLRQGRQWHDAVLELVGWQQGLPFFLIDESIFHGKLLCQRPFRFCLLRETCSTKETDIMHFFPAKCGYEVYDIFGILVNKRGLYVLYLTLGFNDHCHCLKSCRYWLLTGCSR